jgi:hypothetical protein
MVDHASILFPGGPGKRPLPAKPNEGLSLGRPSEEPMYPRCHLGVMTQPDIPAIRQDS